ncbi:MAG: NAD(P)-dependent oxidoreductase [Acidiferrobacteraceae bacterium]|nr:NAD(P)-dependent oxidoreductase [Acidiferrobacteraceae bacterium]MBT4403731.1 NAD(P)-dependent oxidoreductase [Acidiferrobacteraceae bacterium]MBT4807548.1 NAD(P)-dependent oxidoreductase [Acidiferrobacteraceae bacterium]MBT5343330.1 NAD(P)-dependent oxidoreductase [Acidiferrobacteraceae bacterium]MBT5622654.1 NAD(P)-dependent oxidoreductase [Acidiferrobacteraceae bacterium]
MHSPLEPNSARVEAERCYFCFDAPCTQACPTEIDIPGFIRMIGNHNPVGAAGLILQENIMGGTCARACPVETLCEHTCVRNQPDDRPVSIGLLQRYAVDEAMDQNASFFIRGALSEKSVAVVGAGPAGLACAHRLAVLGHSVCIYEHRPKSGGLNEYGLAAYKMLDNFAQKEAEFITSIGGIEIEHGKLLGRDFHLRDIEDRHDAVFLSAGLGSTKTLGIPGEEVSGVEDAVDFISQIRQADQLSSLALGKRIVVIGGGMTAIDIAVQTRLLGAEDVTIVYRRGPQQMKASIEEQEFAKIRGVVIRYWGQPACIQHQDGRVTGVEFSPTDRDLHADGAGHFTIEADTVFRAIGQAPQLLNDDAEGFNLEGGRFVVDEERRTSRAGVWAGGDCIADGEDLTVSAVQDGKLAAISIDQFLSKSKAGEP